MSAPSVSCRIHTCSCRSLHASYTHATHRYVTPQYKRLDCLFRPARAATRRPHSLVAEAAAHVPQADYVHNEAHAVSTCIGRTLVDVNCGSAIYKAPLLAQEAESIASPVLPPISSKQQLDSEERWLADTIQARMLSSEHAGC
jgi:hypothetical protein